MKSTFAALAVLGALAAPTLVFAEDVVDVGNTAIPHGQVSVNTQRSNIAAEPRDSRLTNLQLQQRESMLPDGGAGAEQ